MQPMPIITMSTEPPGRAEEHRDDDQACHQAGGDGQAVRCSAQDPAARPSRRSCPIGTTSGRPSRSTTISDITANASD